MLVLTDSIQAVTQIGIDPESLEETAVSSLPNDLGNLWAGLSPLKQCLLVEVAEESFGLIWDVLAVIGNSQESQFDALVKGLDQNVELPANAACLAMEGSHFHGQRSRGWEALAGNLHLSAFLKPQLAVSGCQVGFTMLPTLCVVDMIRSVFPNAPYVGIKWVNDILVDESKVAGVLTETQIEGDQIQSVVLGLGVNVSKAPEFTPNRFVPEADSLAACLPDVSWNLNVCVRALLRAIENRYDQLIQHGDLSLLEDYRHDSHTLNRDVLIWETGEEDLGQGSPIAQGKVLSIEPDLSLILEGNPNPIRHGRLVYAENPRGL